ncbi:MAG: BT_3928 family protein [Bacteroidota bacterium]
MRAIQEFSRYAVAALFIFSGLIKINDPVGTEIKLKEYFEVFAADIAPFFEWFIPLALFLSVFLSVLEVVLGIALIIGYRMQLTSRILLAMIIFFTFLTFYSAYFNKVTDCGCFGDAIKLTPWQSFYKDIILVVLIGIIYLGRNSYEPWFNKYLREIKIISSTTILIILAVYAIRNLPFIDFRTYKVGSDLPSLMKNSAPLEYEYIMEKNGETFTFETYPSDPSYTYVDAKLTNPEALAKISDLNVWQDEGDYTQELFNGNKLLIVVHDVKSASTKQIDRIRNLTYNNESYETWVLTSSGPTDFEEFRHRHQLAAPYFYADATVLKTMIRSNPGVLLLQDGTVRAKWHFNNTPLAGEVVDKLQ